MSPLCPLVKEIEQRLSEYYHFTPLTSADDHFISREDLLSTLGNSAASKPEWSQRAAVWLIENNYSSSDLFIGIHINQEIEHVLLTTKPNKSLNDDNLDAFCVLIEELSHFHLIINRAKSGRSVSQLELEWQGEIDKLLVCALLLFEQSGDSHILPLAHKLFNCAVITAEHQYERYRLATHYAAKFWHNVKSYDHLFHEKVRNALIAKYYAPWQEKLRLIHLMKQERISA